MEFKRLDNASAQIKALQQFLGKNKTINPNPEEEIIANFSPEALKLMQLIDDNSALIQQNIVDNLEEIVELIDEMREAGDFLGDRYTGS